MKRSSVHRTNATSAKADKGLIIGIALNLAFVVVEATAGFWENSLALLSDAGHNLFDVASLALALLAFRLARVTPTDQYTYGYRKTTILVALLNAVILLIAIGGIGIEAVQRIWNPQPVTGGTMAIVAAIGIFINGYTAYLFMHEKDQDLNIKGAYLHMAADALVSLGVVLAGLLIMWTGWYLLDPIISFVIMIVIVISTWSLLRDSLRLSMDGVPKEINMEAVRQVTADIPEVLDLHHLHVWAISTTENALTAHLVVAPDMALQETEAIKTRLKEKLRQLNIQHSTFEVETSTNSCTQACCECEGSMPAVHLHHHH